MADLNTLLKADEQRRQAMIEGDVETLDGLLCDDLIWTHSSGATEDKALVLAALKSGSVKYQVLNVSDVKAIALDGNWVLGGRLDGRASRDGNEKTLCARFLAVWRVQSQGPALLAWQSTNLAS